MSSFEIIPTEPTASTAQMLIAELDVELSEHYPGEPCNGINAEEFEDIGGTFILAFANGMPVGCGAAYPVDTETAELKRMFVRRENRGQGIAQAILNHLELWSKERGYEKLILETGDRLTEALTFYQNHGFTRIENYAPYNESQRSRCFAKTLEALT
jgi:putative acetyltransferase